MYVFDTKGLLLKFSKLMRYYTYDSFKSIPSFSVKDILETIKWLWYFTLSDKTNIISWLL